MTRETATVEGTVGAAVVSEAEITRALDQIRRDGYAVLRSVVPDEPLRELERDINESFEDAESSGSLFKGGGTLTGHLNCFPGAGSRAVYDELDRRGALGIARALVPDDAEHIRITTNYNLPGSVDQHYHADGLYVEEFLICNIAVVDTDTINGAIDLLPGTHQRFYKFWQYALQRKSRSSTRICMKRGDVLFRLSTVWHRGTSNYSSTARPMMSITFGELSSPPSDPFGLDGEKPHFSPNWYSTSRAGEIRERVYVSAPWTYSTYRFGRSLVGNKGYSSW
jgi:hypothetical protein